MQTLVRISANVFARIETFRTSPLSTGPAELRQQALELQHLLPHTANLATLKPDVEVVARLRSERNEARLERDQHRTGKVASNSGWQTPNRS